MIVVLILVVILTGLFFLSLALNYPYKKLFNKKPNSKHIPYFHIIGWSLCAIGMLITIKIFGIGIGIGIVIVYLFGYVTFLSLVLVLFYSFAF